MARSKMKQAEFDKKYQEIIQTLQEEVTPLDKSGKRGRLQDAEFDFFKFFETYLPHYAGQEVAEFHREIVDYFEKEFEVVCPFVAAAPRGFGKSTLLFGFVLWCLLFKKKKFMVYLSATEDLAKDFTEFLLLELKLNERINQDFTFSTSRSEKADFVVNGIRVFSRGADQAVRGFKYRNNRPDCFIIDDMEKDKAAANPRLVIEREKIIKEAIMPAIAPGGHLFIIGTIIRKRSVLGKILLHNDAPYNTWQRKIYRALEWVDGEERSIWESRWPTKHLKTLRVTMGTIAFNKEYQNNPGDEESEAFQESWIMGNLYDLNEIEISRLTKVTMIDPSARHKDTNDYKAIVTLGLDQEKMIYYILNAWIKKTSIKNMIYATYRIYKKFTPVVVGVESNGFQSLIKIVYDMIAEQVGFLLPIKQVENWENKEDRIMTLSPIFEVGRVKTKREYDDDTGLLIEQLLFFPSTVVHDDGPDALAGAYKLLKDYAKTGKSSFTPAKPLQSSSLFHGYGSVDDWKYF